MPDQKRHGLLAQAGLEPYQEKPGEEYMNEAQRAHFKTILETWRNDLRNEVDRTKSHMQDEAANFPDPVDRAVELLEVALRDHLAATDELRGDLARLRGGGDVGDLAVLQSIRYATRADPPADRCRRAVDLHEPQPRETLHLGHPHRIVRDQDDDLAQS